MAQGYVPNFAGGLRDAIRRESLAEFPKAQCALDQDRRLANKGNPLGLAVTNTRDEPRGIKDVLANGYIPNFAALNFRDIDAPAPQASLDPKTTEKANNSLKGKPKS